MQEPNALWCGTNLISKHEFFSPKREKETQPWLEVQEQNSYHSLTDQETHSFKPRQALFTICRKKVLQFRYLWNFSTVSQVCNTWSPTFLRIYFLLSYFRQAQDFVIFKGPKIFFFSITDQLLFPAVTDVISFLLSNIRYQIWCNKLFWKTVVWIFNYSVLGFCVKIHRWKQRWSQRLAGSAGPGMPGCQCRAAPASGRHSRRQEGSRYHECNSWWE